MLYSTTFMKDSNKTKKFGTVLSFQKKLMRAGLEPAPPDYEPSELPNTQPHQKNLV